MRPNGVLIVASSLAISCGVIYKYTSCISIPEKYLNYRNLYRISSVSAEVQICCNSRVFGIRRWLPQIPGDSHSPLMDAQRKYSNRTTRLELLSLCQPAYLTHSSQS